MTRTCLPSPAAQCLTTAALVLLVFSSAHGQTAGATAKAELKDATGKAVGRAQLQETPNGVLVHLTLTSAAPGVHGFHVHQTGKCEPPSFSSAGGHFDPTKVPHGFQVAGGPHAGDLPNLHVPSGGALEVELRLPHASLRGAKHALLDDDGAALVLHAGADDYRTDPAGSSGDRVACGVIGS